MADEDECEDGNEGADRRPGRRPRWLKIVGCVLAGVLVLGAGGAGWAFWRLNGNIESVDINSALGDNRPAKLQPTGSPSPWPAPATASATAVTWAE